MVELRISCDSALKFDSEYIAVIGNGIKLERTECACQWPARLAVGEPELNAVSAATQGALVLIGIR